MRVLSTPIQLLGLTAAELRSQIDHRIGRGRGLATQLHRNAHREAEFDPQAFGAGSALADALRREFALDLPEVVSRPSGEDGTEFRSDTEKAVIELRDGLRVETVRIGMGRGREAQCLSTQVGCAQACRFCETGRMGLLRSLTPDEITAQVVVARTRLDWRPRTLVFQGMGEPLDNTESLIPALEVLTDSNGLGFGRDKLTICTAGHVDGLARLRELGWSRLNLSLSLNAADDEQRRELMPINRHWPLADVQRELIAMRRRANWQLGIHWCLMPNWNDTREDAARLASFCAPLGRVLVHLIPYNPGTHPLTRVPTEDEVVRFVGWLRDEGLPVRRRITKGRDAMAACGQLGDLALRRQTAPQDS